MSLSIVFTGHLAEGFDEAKVKQQAASLFKLSAADVNKLFQGKPITLKKGLARPAAEKYHKILTQIGMIVELREPQASTQTQASNTETPKPQKTQEKPAAEYKVLEPSVAPPIKTLPLHSRITSPGHSADELLKDFPPAETWQLAEVGARLSQPQDRADSPISDTDFPLSPQQGNILRADELPPEVVANIDFSVLDTLTLSEQGEYLIPAPERIVPPEVNIDTSHLSVEPAGGYLVPKTERPKEVHREIDTSGLTLK